MSQNEWQKLNVETGQSSPVSNVGELSETLATLLELAKHGLLLPLTSHRNEIHVLVELFNELIETAVAEGVRRALAKAPEPAEPTRPAVLLPIAVAKMRRLQKQFLARAQIEDMRQAQEEERNVDAMLAQLTKPKEETVPKVKVKHSGAFCEQCSWCGNMNVVGSIELADRLSLKIGDRVVVRHDDGRRLIHTVREEPWMLGHGVWVVSLTGISGGYSLERVERIVAPEGGAAMNPAART